LYRPLADELRPTDIDDIVGQSHIFGLKTDAPAVFWRREHPQYGFFHGPSGTRKTTVVARMIADEGPTERSAS
jgi:putative ATPase